MVVVVVGGGGGGLSNVVCVSDCVGPLVINVLRLLTHLLPREYFLQS